MTAARLPAPLMLIEGTWSAQMPIVVHCRHTLLNVACVILLYAASCTVSESSLAYSNWPQGGSFRTLNIKCRRRSFLGFANGVRRQPCARKVPRDASLFQRYASLSPSIVQCSRASASIFARLVGALSRLGPCRLRCVMQAAHLMTISADSNRFDRHISDSARLPLPLPADLRWLLRASLSSQFRHPLP